MNANTQPWLESSTIITKLHQLAENRPHDIAFIVEKASCEIAIDYFDLRQRIYHLAQLLQQKFSPAERVLILLDNDEHYVVSFFACLAAGLVAVPVFPPSSSKEQHINRLVGIAADAQAVAILTSTPMAKLINMQPHIFGDAALLIVDEVDSIQSQTPFNDSWVPFVARQDDTAFLQYTSGSTSAPKGVMITHANLMANELAIQQSLKISPADIIVSWLPLYHDMGLIGFMIQAVYSGVKMLLMSPLYFLEQPLRWLSAISRHRATISGGPDFSYRLCAERIEAEDIAQLDLSSWRLALSGAEPVRADTCLSFIECFASSGFDAGSIRPSYGLAEATLMLTTAHTGDKQGLVSKGFLAAALAQGCVEPADIDGAGNDQPVSVLVACGSIARQHQLLIMDVAAQQPCAADKIGEIWASGPSIAQGYWQRKEATQEAFVEYEGQRWLRTGDLGFIYEGQLYIAGRCKDIIIVRGHNLYPQDIEKTVEGQIEVIRKGRSAAFAIVTANGDEGIGLAVEVSKSLQKLVPVQNLFDEINTVVSEYCGEVLSVLLLLNPGALPKTSSGKLQRSACKAAWQQHQIDAYALYEYGQWVDMVEKKQANDASSLKSKSHPQQEVGHSGLLSPLEKRLAQLWEKVLVKSPIQADSHFMANGGNSLKATQLVSLIREEWGVDFSLKQLFEVPRLKQCAAFIEQLIADGITAHILNIPTLNPDEKQHSLPLSYAQQRQWFLWQMQPESSAYHIAGLLNLEGLLSVEGLEAVFKTLIARHESLRTVFRTVSNGDVQQFIYPSIDFELSIIEAQDALVGQHFIQQIHNAPFDLTVGPLLRVALLKQATDRHQLVLVMHHIISDGWSVQQLLQEFSLLYRAQRESTKAMLPDLAFQYADYAVWQREWLQQGEAARQLAYWTQQLKPQDGLEQPVLQLTTDLPRHSNARYSAARHQIVIPADMSEALRQFGQKNDTSLFTLLLTALQVVLYRHTAQQDIRIGVPVANRHHRGTEALVGFFVNTLVLRSQLNGRLTLTEALGQARNTVLDAHQHPDLPFEQLVDALLTERSASHNPLFQVLYNHLPSDYQTIDLPDLSLTWQTLGAQAAPFELSLDSVELASGDIELTFTYAAELFQPVRICRLAEHYLNVIQQITRTPHVTVAEIVLLGAEEQAELTGWGQPDFDVSVYDKHAFIPVSRLIEKQAQQQPDATALIFDDQKLTYAELNGRANQLAHYLIDMGVKSETKLGIALQRSVDMIVALLAVLKAGAAYVPLDPEYPQERLSYMMMDSGIHYLLTHADIEERFLTATHVEVIVIDQLDLTRSNQSLECLSNPQLSIHHDNMAYIIYTSGSTGKPKGVVVSHGGISMHVQTIGASYGMTPADNELQFASINFDGAHERWLVPLAFGATLIPRDNDLWSVDKTCQVMAEHAVTIACFTPSYLHQLAEVVGESAQNLAIRSYTVGGEAMSRASFDFVQRVLKPPRIINGYGPTETVITPMIAKAYPDTTFDSAYMPIGRLVGVRTAYVLDTDLNQVPIGATGELYLGGYGLARGYLSRAGLTAERFIANPFTENSSTSGQRLYRTGDLVRWRGDGELEYLGRIDHQVKVRGFRIELGEVEAQIMQHPHVKEAVVVVQQDVAANRLIAYVAPTNMAIFNKDDLRACLTKALPDYMLPGSIMVLDSLPLNPNGKVDRHALPEAIFSAEQVYEAPQGEIEEKLAHIWQKVLGVEQVGRQDNFFSLGGDSILALKVVALAGEQGLKFSPKELLEHQVIALVAQDIEVNQQAEHNNIVTLEQLKQPEQWLTGELALTDTQHLLLGNISNDSQFLSSVHYVLVDVGAQANAEIMQQVLTAMQKYHDVLRLRVLKNKNGWQQYYAVPEHISLQHIGINAQQSLSQVIDTQLTEWISKLDLSDLIDTNKQINSEHSRGSLFKAIWLEQTALDNKQQYLLLVAHSWLMDSYSWQLLLKQTATVYQGLIAHQGRTNAVSLPAKTEGLAAWQQAAMRQFPQLAQRSVKVPSTAGSSGTVNIAKAVVQLSQVHTQQLYTQAREAYRMHVNEVLVVALSLTVDKQPQSWLLQIDTDTRQQLTTFEGVLGKLSILTQVLINEKLQDGSDDAIDVNLAGHIKQVKERYRFAQRDLQTIVLDIELEKDTNDEAVNALNPLTIHFNGLSCMPDKNALSWSVVAEQTAQSIEASHHLLTTYGHITVSVQAALDGLQIIWQGQDADQIQHLAQRYEQQLLRLLEHCLDPGNAGVTPSDFPLLHLSQQQLDVLPIPVQHIQDAYPLTPMQHGMLIQTLRNPNSGMYLMQDRYRFGNGLNLDAFKKAWQRTIDSHPALKTTYVWQLDERPFQIIHRNIELPCVYQDWSSLDEATAIANFDAALADELTQGFVMDGSPLIRLFVARVSEQAYHWALSFHHSIMDAWCLSLLMMDFFRHYDAYQQGRESAKTVSRPHRDFIAWLQQQDKQAEKQYWQNMLHDFDTVTHIPLQLHAASTTEVSSVEDLELILNQVETLQLQQTAKKYQVTQNTLIQAAWALLLARYSSQPDVLFGVTVAGRPTELEGVQQTVGIFINTIPLRIRLPEQINEPVFVWWQRLLEQNAQMRNYEHLPLAEIQTYSKIPYGQPLFESLLVFENAPIDSILFDRLAQEKGKPLGTRTHTNYPITVVIIPSNGTLSLQLSYDVRLFRAQDIKTLLHHFKLILSQFVQQPTQPVHQINLLSADDIKAMVELGQGSNDSYPFDAGYAALFEAQVVQHAQRPAVRCLSEQLSYTRLNESANGIAHLLRQYGVKVDDVVALLCERGIPLVTSIVASFKATAAYLAFDLKLPAQRIARALALSQAKVLIVQQAQAELLKPILKAMPETFQIQVLIYEELQANAGEADNLAIPSKPQQAAYVIFTSGSTGEPKGVVVSSQGMLNNQLSKIPEFQLTEQDVIAQTASPSFDISVWQLLAGLLCGACVEVIPDHIAHHPQALLQHVQQTGITVLESVPALIQGMLDIEPIAVPSLRWMLPTGEASTLTLVQQWFNRYPHIPLVNAYGPAECADDVALYHVKQWSDAVDGDGTAGNSRGKNHELSSNLAIGRPTPNTQLYVLDQALNPVPNGVAGELYIQGVGVGRGYLSRPDLTAERFVPDPLAKVSGARMYRTGDIARFRSNGVLEYLGRVDQQVKIRGFRIELAEIEAQLVKLEEVKEAAVIVYQQPAESTHQFERHLVGYIVLNKTEHNGALDEQETFNQNQNSQQHKDSLKEQLRMHLLQYLPEYMVPYYWVELDQLPRNNNGKVDRKVLPVPELAQLRPYIAPEGDLELALAAIWQDVLAVQQVGRHDNFFELGGHSLKAMQVASRIKANLQLDLTMNDLFETQTLSQFAARLAVARPQASDQALSDIDAFMDALETL